MNESKFTIIKEHKGVWYGGNGIKYLDDGVCSKFSKLSVNNKIYLDTRKKYDTISSGMVYLEPNLLLYKGELNKIGSRNLEMNYNGEDVSLGLWNDNENKYVTKGEKFNHIFNNNSSYDWYYSKTLQLDDFYDIDFGKMTCKALFLNYFHDKKQIQVNLKNINKVFKILPKNNNIDSIEINSDCDSIMLSSNITKEGIGVELSKCIFNVPLKMNYLKYNATIEKCLLNKGCEFIDNEFYKNSKILYLKSSNIFGDGKIQCKNISIYDTSTIEPEIKSKVIIIDTADRKGMTRININKLIINNSSDNGNISFRNKKNNFIYLNIKELEIKNYESFEFKQLVNDFKKEIQVDILKSNLEYKEIKFIFNKFRKNYGDDANLYTININATNGINYTFKEGKLQTNINI